MHFIARIAIALGFVTLTAAGSLTAIHSASAKADITAYVYVDDNNTTANTIAGFARHEDGTLTALSGSPFSAGTGAVGKAIGSQGSVQVTDDGKFLLATDGGSNQISVLKIGSDGSLTSASGSPFASGGVGPNSIAIHGNLVYVSNHGDGTAANLPNYTGFTLSSNGTLTPLAGSTYTLSSATANPVQVLFNSTGTHLIGIEDGPTAGPSFIDSFNVAGTGLITLKSHFPGEGVGAFGSEFRPTNPGQLYVSNAHNGANLGTVSALNVAADGSLSDIGASPYKDRQTAPCWVEISHDGKYLFTVNTAVPSISRFEIEKDGTLSLLGSTVFNDPTGLGPVDARLDPSGRTLYVVDGGANAVSAFRVHAGQLDELDASPFALPAGSKPFGIAAVDADN
jgi:6-phosphogluconolactonase (cycloisomerase 2 family)